MCFGVVCAMCCVSTCEHTVCWATTQVCTRVRMQHICVVLCGVVCVCGGQCVVCWLSCVLHVLCASCVMCDAMFCWCCVSCVQCVVCCVLCVVSSCVVDFVCCVKGPCGTQPEQVRHNDHKPLCVAHNRSLCCCVA